MSETIGGTASGGIDKTIGRTALPSAGLQGGEGGWEGWARPSEVDREQWIPSAGRRGGWMTDRRQAIG